MRSTMGYVAYGIQSTKHCILFFLLYFILFILFYFTLFILYYFTSLDMAGEEG